MFDLFFGAWGANYTPLSSSELHAHPEQYAPCTHEHLEYCNHCREFYCLDCRVDTLSASREVASRMRDAFSTNFKALYDYLGEGLIARDYRYEIHS